MVKKEFTYRGYPLPELQKMSLQDFAKIVCSRKRRTLMRGLIPQHKILVEQVRKAEGTKPIRTHCRDMIILPEFVGKVFGIYNGKEFVRTEIRPDMIGDYIGEYALTRKRVAHSAPGIGATRASKYVSLK